MKFFHLSDLHIGLKLVNHDLRADQRYILAQIVTKAHERQPDAIVIAGDIYDKAIPSAEAVGLFDEFITQLHQAVPAAEIMLISGNHDSAQRGVRPGKLLPAALRQALHGQTHHRYG